MPVSKISGLEYEIMYKGSFAMLQVAIPHGHSFMAESDAMVAMSSTLEIGATSQGGITGAIGRMFTNERLFQQTIRAVGGDGVAFFSPTLPGDIAAVEMDGECEYMMCSDGYFASTEGINMGTQLNGMNSGGIGGVISKGLFSGNGFLVATASGRGTLFISSYGAIDHIDIPHGEKFVIDNGHLVAWPTTMMYRVRQASSQGILASLFSGECLVLEFQGPGRVYFQSRNIASLKGFIRSVVPPSR